ncbi:unnamed protein product [Lasius platythorax]|uniref:Uncharacterized protein n=1 Tax=Lasius platythorax TaxID=488582 RepID=A0AAV2P304_9HYME
MLSARGFDRPASPKALGRNRRSVPFAEAAACRRNYRAGTCHDFPISPTKLSGPRDLGADHAFGFVVSIGSDTVYRFGPPVTISDNVSKISVIRLSKQMDFAGNERL